MLRGKLADIWFGSMVILMEVWVPASYYWLYVTKHASSTGRLAVFMNADVSQELGCIFSNAFKFYWFVDVRYSS